MNSSRPPFTPHLARPVVVPVRPGGGAVAWSEHFRLSGERF